MRLLVGLISFLVLDSIFIGSSMNHWKKQVRAIQHTPLKINYDSAVLSYIFIFLSWFYFIYNPNKNRKTYNTKLLLDAFMLGFVIYGIFELTSMSLFSKWSWLSVFMDTIWGGSLYLLVTFIVFSL